MLRMAIDTPGECALQATTAGSNYPGLQIMLTVTRCEPGVGADSR